VAALVAATPFRVGAAGPRFGGPPRQAPATLTTPLLSLRRVPQLVGFAAATSKLDGSLDAALAMRQWEQSPAQACLVVQAGTTTLYSHNPSLPVLPASNLKLLTATAALDKLPANDRFVTAVDADAPPANGVVTGNLYLVGGGDPLLYTPDYAATLPDPAEPYDNLNTLASQVRAAGVTMVTGSVIGDESRYDSQRSVASWVPSYLSTGEAGPLSALEVNDGFATFKPAPVPAPQPAQQAATTFTAALKAAGVTVTGPPAAGTAPAHAVGLTQLASPPLPKVLGVILQRSDNTGAELVTKELGRQVSGAGTTAAGIAVIVADLTADGLPTSGLQMKDGSGLDRGDRATCQLILATLERGGATGAVGQQLPVAARSGTLAGRFGGTAAAGRLRAKTGTLDGVAALSGFVAPAAAAAGGIAGGAGEAFSLISNSVVTEATGEAIGNRVGVVVAQFPQMPPLAAIGPQP
jgi:D-alanyl-D-alanine carboxypeptidase/D-alanyl-D-alanine-endopeptidase (penicillin-binding protein 4)